MRAHTGVEGYLLSTGFAVRELRCNDPRRRAPGSPGPQEKLRRGWPRHAALGLGGDGAPLFGGWRRTSAGREIHARRDCHSRYVSRLPFTLAVCPSLENGRAEAAAAPLWPQARCRDQLRVSRGPCARVLQARSSVDSRADPRPGRHWPPRYPGAKAASVVHRLRSTLPSRSPAR